jgi:uncharacterized protein (TIGR02145 family)
LSVSGLTIGIGKGSVSGNTAIGYHALNSNTTGPSNTANGFGALFSNTTGANNTATGYQAMYNHTGGGGNTAFGFRSLYSNITSDYNTAIGDNALFSNTTGHDNTAIGAEALYSNTTGSANVANSHTALFSNTTGWNNIATGFNALYLNKTGSGNTAYGYFAGYSNIAGNNNVFLGSSAGYYETGSNKLFIDNQQRANETDARTKALIYGVFDADPANQVLTINGSVNVGNHKITNVADPVNAQDAATKAYVDILEQKINRLSWILEDPAKRGLVKDIEGNEYKTIIIGTQTWTAENLKTTKYNDGTAIPNVTDNAAWAALTTAACCWYNNDPGLKNTYGALYNWYAVNTGKLCPSGWHVPSDAEWTTLTNYLGGYLVAGGKLKETGTTYWQSPNTGATNESGFTARPGGDRYPTSGTFIYLGQHGSWWATDAYAMRSLAHNLNDVYANTGGMPQSGYSVRCLKD